MPDVVSSDGGGGTSTSAATPASLHAAGVAFRSQSNVCFDLADHSTLHAGGAVEVGLANIRPDTGGVPGDFAGDMVTFAWQFYGAVISAQQQLADAALDLMQCAGDFKVADTALPSNYSVPEPSKGPEGEPMPGITTRLAPNGDYYYTDRSGAILAEPLSAHEVEMGQATPYNTSYHPPAGGQR